MPEKILVVDDEVEIVRILRGYLERAGYTVLSAYTGPEAVRMARQESPALMVLDLMLPGMDGWDVCRTLRRESDVPIIMLTARVEETDRVIGLELGADDYVTKPFSPREVVARVRAVLRRVQGPRAPEAERLTVDALVLDAARHTVTMDGRAVDLTPTEFEILQALMREPGRVLSRLQLLEAATGEAYEGYERTVDTHIKNMRRKIEDEPTSPTYLLTVHGVGYKMREA
jgi:two-component system alkaline phosphatase synthesis response regulator PhoP